MTPTLIVIISLSVALFYSFLIARVIMGWYSIPEYTPQKRKPEMKVSLVIPFRNEIEVLGKSVPGILGQDYPEDLLDIIYVNDHSDDGSVEEIKKLTRDLKNCRVLSCGPESIGKKAAIREGAYHAAGNLLLFTDADCYPHPGWVKTMSSFYNEYKPVMISGPVLIQPGKGLFQKFQSLEFLSLIGAGAGSFGDGNPIMCNGANLGFDKKIYLKSIDNIHSEVPSGDDIFMMLHLKKAYAGKLHFIKAHSALVYTEHVGKARQFVKQRMRWASKSRYYKDASILVTGIIVLMMNIFILALGMGSFFNHSFLMLFGIMFIIKSAFDYVLLRAVTSFFGQKKLMNVFIPVQLLYPIYSVFTGMAGLLVKTGWKGRKQ